MGLSPAFLQVADEDTLWTLARRATEGIAAVRSPETVVGLTRFLEISSPELRHRLRLCRSAPTGSGLNDFKTSASYRSKRKSDSLEVKAIWGPILNTQVSQSDMIGINTLDGILRMVHVYSGGRRHLSWQTFTMLSRRR